MLGYSLEDETLTRIAEGFTLVLTVNKGGFKGCHMFISPYVDPELEPWYIRKVNGYPCYKTITSVSSEVQVKNVFIS